MVLATREFAGGSSSSDRTNPNLNTSEIEEFNFEENHDILEDGYESADGTNDNNPLLKNTNKGPFKVGGSIVVNLSGRCNFSI
jgi:hypothetical protein